MSEVPGRPLVSTLRRLLRPPDPAGADACDLCATRLPDPHTHVVDIRTRRLLCTCLVCGTLDHTSPRRQAAIGSTAGRYRVVPRRYVHLPSMTISAAQWQALAIPVDLVFFFFNSTLGRTVALYPGPLGATESLLPLDAWNEIVAANPDLATLQPDVEALLVRTVDGPRADGSGPECFIVPIDVCYELVGELRRVWRGFDGGTEAHAAVRSFFERVRSRATAAVQA